MQEKKDNNNDNNNNNNNDNENKRLRKIKRLKICNYIKVKIKKFGSE